MINQEDDIYLRRWTFKIFQCPMKVATIKANYNGTGPDFLHNLS